MAYSTSNPPALISQGVARGTNQEVRIFQYADGDDLGTITASGYISNAYELGMKDGDKVICYDSTNDITNECQVVAHTKGTAAGATTNAAGYAVGVSVVTLASAGTGTVLEDDIITFDGDSTEYRVTAGDADVSGGGTVNFTPTLAVAIAAAATAITVKSNVYKLRAANTRGAITLDEARTLTASDSGTTFYLALAGGFTTTLPAPADGLNFKFVVKIAPTTAYVITTNGGADILIGGVNELETDTGDDGPYDDNADTINLVASVAVVGDYIQMESDGTSWYFNGQTNADGGVTTSTT